MPSKDFQVSIVGGGIVGLACAIGLARSGIQTDLFEAAPKYGEVGAGVGVGANAVRIIQKLGVLDAVVARSDDPEPKMRFFKFRRGVEPHDDIYHYPGEPQDIGLGLHRADFVDALASAIDPSKVAEHFGKRCVDVTIAPSGRQIIHFADGTTHETDVVIGADGIKSSVRRLVVGEEASAKSLKFTNTLVYRGLVPVAELVHEGVKTDVLSWPVCWFGDDKHLITFPIKNSKVLNVVVFTTDYSKPMQPAGPQSDWSSWVQPATQEEMISHYSGWGPDVQALLRCIKEPSRWAVHGLYPPLESYTRGRIAIIGDAAHAMLPHLGSGAGAGIEDAYVLAQLLGHPQTNRNNLDAVLRVHSIVRVPRASFISLASKEAGEVYEGRGPAGGGDEGLLKDINLQWHEVWHHDIEDEIRQAENILVKEGAFTQTTP